MTISPADRLRQELGESIPSGGSADETLFSDPEITQFLADFPLFESSVRKGWDIKRKRLSDMVDMAEGGSRRQLSQLWDRAQREFELAQIQETKALAEQGVVAEGTTINKIVRPRRAADLPKSTEFGGHPGSPARYWHFPYPYRRPQR